MLALLSVAVSVHGLAIQKNSTAALVKDRDVLPDSVKPLNYKLQVQPDLNQFTFKGKVEIKLAVLQDTQEILLNAVDLNFTSSSLSLDSSSSNATGATRNSAQVQIDKVSLDKDKQVVSLSLDQELTRGTNVTLAIEYDGTLNDRLVGFYRSSFKDPQTHRIIYMAVTNFQPGDARRCLPCFDQPDMKATFDVSIVCSANLTALSNTNVISTRVVGNGTKEVTFATTPLMSTYLLAMVVGDLDYVEAVADDAKKTVLRVYAPKGEANDGKFALEVASKSLKYYSGYFQIPYPLPKLDLVAVNDFSGSAMENWGLNIYQSSAVLFNEESSTSQAKLDVAYLVNHEVSHQWFGNYVTPTWWDALFLNEGFATWAGWVAVDAFYLDWQVWNYFLSGTYRAGLTADSVRSSRPIQAVVRNSSVATQVFDTVTYRKGASVIRMLSTYLGEQDFKTGLQTYMREFLYRNAEIEDLWLHLEKASGKPVGKFMREWTQQPGFPLVKVVQNGNVLTISQQRFLSDDGGNASTSANRSTVWQVPLQIITSDSHSQSLGGLLQESQQEIEIPGLSQASYFKLNHLHTGFYRTQYEAAALVKIGEAIEQGKLTSADRIGLVADCFALGKSGIGSTVDGLKLLERFRTEDQYGVLQQIALDLGQFRTVFSNQPKEVLSKIAQLTLGVFLPAAKQVGWEYDSKEDFITKQLRSLVLGQVLVQGRDAGFIAEAMRRFQSFIAGNQSAIHPDLRQAVLSTAVAEGGVKEWDSVMGLYTNASTSEQKNTFLYALGMTRDEKLIKKTLDFALTPAVASDDISSVMLAMLDSPQGIKIMWEWVKLNWNLLSQRFSSGILSDLDIMVELSLQALNSQEYYNDAKSFFDSKETSSISRSIETGLERIQRQAQWIKRDRDLVAEWAKQYN
ncbi:hypothetical protein MP228_009163 [Amoeboaphelidium protococcarum]|nr:hypothetical protein MP228_009163 [Amoeboaphelidium protococcarum]